MHASLCDTGPQTSCSREKFVGFSGLLDIIRLMAHHTDHELLADFVKNDSESAFSALVARYVNLVYSTALRHTSNPHHAEEITQAVFILLARNAGINRRGCRRDSAE